MSTQASANIQISVCVIEDHTDFRETLIESIQATTNLSCQASFSNAESAFAYLQQSPAPDIIILDLGLPGVDGIEAIPQLQALASKSKILVLTVFENKTRVFQALGAGAAGYIIKSSGINAITKGIEEAYHGIAPLSAEIANMVFATFSKIKPSSSEAEISERETEVLQRLAEGGTRKEIAHTMNVSVHTIDSHVRNIYRKLHVHNISGAINKAISLKIL